MSEGDAKRHTIRVFDFSKQREVDITFAAQFLKASHRAVDPALLDSFTQPPSEQWFIPFERPRTSLLTRMLNRLTGRLD